MIVLDPIRSSERTFRKRFGILALVLLSVMTAAVGTAGFSRCRNAAGDFNSLADAIYLSIQLFALESGIVKSPIPWSLQIARFLAPVLTVTALAKALAGLFRSELRNFRLARSRGHVVICGAGTKAAALIRDYGRAGRRIVVIDAKATQSLPEVSGGAEVYAIQGEATNANALRLARAKYAERVFITTGNDSTNIEIAAGLIRHCNEAGHGKGQVVCHVHLVDRQTEELFKRHRIFKDATDRIDVQTFNVYENAARLLWRDRLLACGPLAPDDTRRLHMAIGGLGQMGEAVLLRLVRSAHFANGRKPAVTVFDIKVDEVRQRILDRYPAMPRFCDLAFVEADLRLPETARRISATLAESGQIGVVALCLDDDYANFAAALQLAPRLDAIATPIFIRLSSAAGLYELLQSERSDAAQARRIDGFGLIHTCCTPELVTSAALDATARAFHEAYRMDRQRAGAPASPTLVPWEDLDKAYRESNRENAEHNEVKLRTLGFAACGPHRRLPDGFSATEIERLAKMEHARWCAERELAGWSYAPGPKDAQRLTSPHLVPWEDLSEDIRQIDRDFVAAIPRILHALPCADSARPPLP